MIELSVNGVRRQFNAIRTCPCSGTSGDEIGLTGSKFGCGAGLCGACTVHVDGAAVRGCITPVADAAGGAVTTIEGLDLEGNHPVQRAWARAQRAAMRVLPDRPDHDAAAFLAENPDPTDGEILDAMDGNLCRCGTYQRIAAAVRTAAMEA